MTKEKETKGAVRYQEVNDQNEMIGPAEGAKIGTLYVRKSAFASGNYPPTIRVVIDIS